jgi:hypothetical protein
VYLQGFINNNKEYAEYEKDQRTDEGILNDIVLRVTLV